MKTTVVESAEHQTFKDDMHNRRLVYDFKVPGVKTASGTPETWRCEMRFHSWDGVAYTIHRGRRAGQETFRAATYQCIVPGALWHCTWIESAGAVSLVYDIPARRVTTMLGYSTENWHLPLFPETYLERRGSWDGHAAQQEQQGRKFPFSSERRGSLVSVCEQVEILGDFLGEIGLDIDLGKLSLG